MKETSEAAGENAKPVAESAQKIDSNTLFAGRKQLIIRHDGEDYRLILTRNNRLILQK